MKDGVGALRAAFSVLCYSCTNCHSERPFLPCHSDDRPHPIVIQTTEGRKDLGNIAQPKSGCTRDFSPLAQQLVFTTLRSVLNDKGGKPLLMTKEKGSG